MFPDRIEEYSREKKRWRTWVNLKTKSKRDISIDQKKITSNDFRCYHAKNSSINLGGSDMNRDEWYTRTCSGRIDRNFCPSHWFDVQLRTYLTPARVSWWYFTNVKDTSRRQHIHRNIGKLSTIFFPFASSPFHSNGEWERDKHNGWSFLIYGKQGTANDRKNEERERGKTRAIQRERERERERTTWKMRFHQWHSLTEWER